ncbi:MAG: hypothetical protein M1827_006629 [Pycnora praestabilis]|nr:MAG: hypothetical protein M1827_006629 [Pycnora praestabilis]
MALLGGYDWIAVEVALRGKIEAAAQKPVTILITIPEQSHQEWKPLRESIAGLLESLRLPKVALEIIRGRISRSVSLQIQPLPETVWDTKLQMGSSMGPQSSAHSAGALGGFIEILVNGSWKILGLTCSRCVVNVNLDDLQQSQAAPALPDHQDAFIKLDESDSTAADRAKLKDLEGEYEKNDGYLETYKQRLMERLLADLRAADAARVKRMQFFSSNAAHLGTIYAASGMRRTSPVSERFASLDWALIDGDP